MVSLKNNEVKFYGVMKDKLLQKLPSVYPVKGVDFHQITEFITKTNNEIIVHDLNNSGQDQLILRSGKGVGVFEFDSGTIFLLLAYI